MVDIEQQLNSEPVNALEPAAPLAVEPEVSLGDVLELLKAHRTGSVLVCQDGKLQGIFTERDALRLMSQNVDLTQPVKNVMTSPPATISEAGTVGAAIKQMSDGGYRHLPVVGADGSPRGMLKMSILVHYLVQFFPSTVYNQPPTHNQKLEHREGA